MSVLSGCLLNLMPLRGCLSGIKRQMLMVPAMLALLCLSPVSEAAVRKGPSGLSGCELGDIGTSSDATLTVATCAGPFGIYYSTDFGVNWTYGDGGSYTNGEGRAVSVNSSDVFVAVGQPGLIYKDSIANLASGNPAWKSLDFENVSTLTTSGSFLLYGDSSGGVHTVDARSNKLLSTAKISGAKAIDGITVDRNNGLVYVVATNGSIRNAYRASFAVSSGKVGSFSNISANSGLPSSAFIGTIGVSPANRLYISARAGSDLSSTRVYVSTDSGSSFLPTQIDNLLNDSSFSNDGSVELIGNYLSTDSGASFNFLSRSVSDPQLQNTASLLNPVNREMALVKTGLGVARSTDLVSNAGGPTWVDSNSGLTSANVKAFSQLAGDKSRALIGLGTGVGYSENFTAESPTFNLSCPLSSCLESRVTLDPDATSSVFAGYNLIYRGSVSSGVITWSEFIQSPGSTFKLSGLQVPPVMPDKIIVGYQQLFGGPGGGLRIFNKSDGSLFASPLSVPVSSFVAVNSTVVFVGAGYAQDSSFAAADRGIYISRDGGVTFTQMSDADLPSTLLVNQFAYDAARDVLYAATENTTTGERGSGNGSVFILRNVLSESATNWEKTSGTFTNAIAGADESFKAVAVDPDTGHVYVGADRKIWVSNDQGVNWYQYYTGVDGEDIVVLAYDALVSGGPGGLQDYGGEPPSCKSGRATDRNRSVKKRNLLTTVVGRLSNTSLAREPIVLQERQGKKFKTIARGKSSASGQLTFTVAKKSSSYRFVSVQGDVLCKLNTKSR